MRLGAWFEIFSQDLRAGNHSLVPRAVDYVRGLCQADRANIERMSDTTPGSSYQTRHHFISQSPWDDQRVRATNARQLNNLLGGTSYSGLLIDETAFTKKGDKSVGVARQWSGQLGKVENCQVAVFSALCDNEHASLVDSRLFLPEAWTGDPKRCREASIPETDQVYKSKTQLALELVDAADAYGLEYAWVGADAGYGKDPAFLRALEDRGKGFLVDVHSTQLIYTSDPTKTKPIPGARGVRKKLRLTPKALSVKDWVGRQPARKWKNVLLRNGSRGPQRAKVLLGHVWVWDKKEEKARTWRLIVRRRGSDPKKPDDKYSLSNAPGDIPAHMMAWYQGQRFKIEQCFQEGKQELGMDDYQVRSWRAWHHHTTLTLMAMNFLLEEKIRFGGVCPGVSLRGIRELLVAQLPKHGFEMVLEQVKRRAARSEQAKKRGSPR